MSTKLDALQSSVFIISEGPIPEPYNLELLQLAWKMKKR